MKKRSFENGAALGAAAITLPMVSTLWLLAVPGIMSPMTFAVVSLLAVAGAYVAFNTWRNGQATENIGHVLQRAEAGARRSAR
jgi:hypothetical protein